MNAPKQHPYLTDEDIHGPWDKEQQIYADGCESDATDDHR